MLRDIRDMTKRYLRLIAQVVDENGNKVFNPTSDCVQTALRHDVENIESTHWDILLMHLGSVISFGLRTYPFLLPLYPEIPYLSPTDESENALPKARLIYGGYEVGNWEQENLHKDTSVNESEKK